MTKYAKPREVPNAHIQRIMGLPATTETNPTRINEFYEKLVTNIHTLESMGKKKDIRGYVTLTLDTLPGIRADLVKLDDNWQVWRFPQLLEALRKWVWLWEELSPPGWHPGRRDKGKDHCFKLNKRVKSIGVVFTVSLRNIISWLTRLLGVGDKRRYLSDNKLCLTVLAPGIELQNADALLLARGVMGSTIIWFVISFQTSWC